MKTDYKTLIDDIMNGPDDTEILLAAAAMQAMGTLLYEASRAHQQTYKTFRFEIEHAADGFTMYAGQSRVSFHRTGGKIELKTKGVGLVHMMFSEAEADCWTPGTYILKAGEHPDAVLREHAEQRISKALVLLVRSRAR